MPNYTNIVYLLYLMRIALRSPNSDFSTSDEQSQGAISKGEESIHTVWISGKRPSWNEVFRVAEQHHVLPMVVDAAYKEFGNDIPTDLLTPYKKRAQRLTYIQTMRTERFLSAYRFLNEQGMTPLVVKGLICRELYPNPDYRFSADEDLLIPLDEAAKYHDVLLKYGLITDFTAQMAASEQETSYRSADGVLLLEVHRYAFPPDSDVYGKYNVFFENAFERATLISSGGVDVWTMAPTDHLLYLICHALKHFLHGGFGIRQVCDIGLFAQRYGAEIEWTYLAEQIRSINAEIFTTSLMNIAEKVLGIDLSEVPEMFRSCENDYEALLDDIMESGVYGSSTMSRKHSAAITLRAAEETSGITKRDKINAIHTNHSMVRTIFPTASAMKKAYPYVANKPWLLPAAWTQRIIRYIRESDAANTPGDALRIGHKRVALMRKYGLADDLYAAPHKTIKEVDTGEYLSALCELVEHGNEVGIPVAGSSMTPFLGDGRDQIFVSTPKRPIRKGDIVLFRRHDGIYVLHRVCRVHGAGEKATYDVIGDAQNRIECGVPGKQIFAVATRVRRKGKIIGTKSLYWMFFQHIWIRIIPLRRILMRLYAVIK